MWRGPSSHSWLLQPQDELSVRISSGRVKKESEQQDLGEWHENVSGKVKVGCWKKIQPA